MPELIATDSEEEALPKEKVVESDSDDDIELVKCMGEDFWEKSGSRSMPAQVKAAASAGSSASESFFPAVP